MKAIYAGTRYGVCDVNGEVVDLRHGPTVPFGDPYLTIDPTDGEWDAAQDGKEPWIYNETKLELLPPGLYLGLMHGRNFPDERLDDWGLNGPIIGPLKYCHTTYAHHIRFKFTSVEAHDRYFPRQKSGWITGVNGKPDTITSWEDSADFVLHEDLLCYKGVYYGDWTVFSAP